MQAVLSDGYRSLALVFDLAADRILVPVAIFLALAAALAIGIGVSALLPGIDPTLHQL